MRKEKYLYLAFSVLILSCNTFLNPKDDSASNPALDINIRDTARFVREKGFIHNFIISPIENNKLWVFAGDDSYELDLKDSSWSSLVSRFGNYSRNLRKSSFFKDIEDANLLWVANWNKGLIIYHINSGQYREFPDIKNIRSMCFLKEVVFIGTSNGALQYSRESGEMARVKKIPDLEIYQLGKTKDGLLLINNKFEYNYLTDTLGVKYKDNEQVTWALFSGKFEITGYQNNILSIRCDDSTSYIDFKYYHYDRIIVDGNNAWIPQYDLLNGIMKYSGKDHSITTFPIGYQCSHFNVIDDNRGIWFYTSGVLLYFNKLDKTTRLIDFETIRLAKNWQVSEDYILANTDHSIHIWLKDYLLANSVGIKEIINEDERINYYRDQFLNNHDYFSRYKVYKDFLEELGTSSNPKFKASNREFWSIIKYNTPNNLEDLKYFIDNQLELVTEDEIRAEFYIKLATLYNYQGKLRECLQTDSILVTNYPSFRDERFSQNMSRVAKTYQSISNALASSLSEEKLLWIQGKEYYELFLYVGPVTEASSINMNFPFQFLKELLAKYPESPYADDAEFIMLSHNEGGSHEGGDNSYNLEAIEEYKRILEKYPGTERRAEIYYKIGGLYMWCEAEYPDKKGYLELARSYLNKVNKEYPDFKEMAQVISLLNEIDYEMPRYMWEFIIESDKEEYKPGESVIITFKMKNLSDESMKYKVNTDKNIPNYILNIIRYPSGAYHSNLDPTSVPFEQGIQEFSSNTDDLSIAPSETYEESWDITKNARGDFRKAPGFYIFNETGAYMITARVTDADLRYIPSNTIWIKVIK